MNPNRIVSIDPAASEQFVVLLCTTADVPVQDEFSREQVAALLRACGYDITPGVIAEFIRKNYVGTPPDDLWTAPHVHALTASLECRRRWMPTPNRYHDAKKSAQRLEIERLVAEGVEPVADLDSHTVEDLLIQLTNADNRMHREAMYECLRLKLAGYEE